MAEAMSRGRARDGLWMVSSRFIAMAIGMLGLPILMSSLGLLQFGAWAVLLGGVFAFSTLELGLSASVMRWYALSQSSDAHFSSASPSAVLTNALACMSAAFLLGGVVLWPAADSLAAWLNLPDTPLLDPGQCILAVYVGVAVSAVLRCTNGVLLATQQVALHSRLTIIQVLVTSGVTWWVAYETRRLDLVILANGGAAIAVKAVSAWIVLRRVPGAIHAREINLPLMWDMVAHGAALQFSALSSFVVFQFDKLMISGVVSPAEVSHFEVASRTAQAMGSLTRAPFESVAPLMAMHYGNNEDISEHAIRLTRTTLITAGFFVFLPMAIAPIGLFAWVGQIGYHAAGVFTLLSLAIVSSLIVLPLSICAQAMGKASLELRRAAIAMVANVPLSIALIHAYGKEGAALGTLIASLLANLYFAVVMLRTLKLPVRRLATATSPLFLRILAVATCTWLAAQAIEPWVISSRWYMAPASAALAGLGAAAMATWLYGGRSLTETERGDLGSLPLLGPCLRWLRSRSARINPA